MASTAAAIWQHTLRSLSTHLGHEAEPEKVIVCVDRKRQWKHAGNVRHAALAVFGALHVVAAIALWDVEAAVMTALLAVAVGIRRRLSRVSAAGLATLLVNMAAWSLPGLVRNLTGAASVWVVLLQAGLVLSALLGLVAMVAQRRSPDASAVGPRLAVATSLALLVGVAVAALGGEPSAGARPGDLEVVASGTAYSPQRLEAPAGEVAVHLRNEDFFWHTFSIPALDVRLSVPMEGSGRVAFDAPAGTWAYTCEIPGHGTVMRGELVVAP